MQTADFYSSATGTLRVNGGRDKNAPQGVSLSIDDLSYIKQGSRATDSSNTGTTDYNELVNKPKINSITLTGNVLLSDIGAQPAIDSSHKVSADNIDDTSTTNKFATVAELEQIETNKNNISAVTMGTRSTGDIDLNAVTTNSYKMYTNTTSNLPTSDGSWYFVKTTMFDNNTMLQEAIAMNAGAKTYTRIKRGGNWQAWMLSNLNSTQEAAVNSGIDSTKVAQIETNKNNISTAQNELALFNHATGSSIFFGETQPVAEMISGSYWISTSGVKIATRSNNQLFSGMLLSGLWSTVDTISDRGHFAYRSFKTFLPAGTYTISFASAVNIVRQIADNALTENIGTNLTEYTLTTTTDDYIGFTFRLTGSTMSPWDNSNIMLNAGGTAMSYEPYVTWA